MIPGKIYIVIISLILKGGVSTGGVGDLFQNRKLSLGNIYGAVGVPISLSERTKTEEYPATLS